MRSETLIRALLVVPIIILIGCQHHKKVDITYRKAPQVLILQNRSLAIHPFENKSDYVNAGQDTQSVIYHMLSDDEDDFFGEVRELKEDIIDFGEGISLDTVVDNSQDFDWPRFREEIGNDLLLLGSISFEADDFSGYESRWVYNQYGYRVPRKVWVDKVRYLYKLRLVLVDPEDKKIIVDETYDEDIIVEGITDEVAGLLSLSEESMREFKELMQGEEVKATRYLIYD